MPSKNEQKLDLLSINRKAEKVVFEEKGPVWKLEDVNFGYTKGKNVFNQVSLHVARGAKIGITGPSGSGKSTLSRLLAGIYLPTLGRVYFKGIDTTALSPPLIGQHLYLLGQGGSVVEGELQGQESRQEAQALGYLAKEVGQVGRERSVKWRRATSVSCWHVA